MVLLFLLLPVFFLSCSSNNVTVDKSLQGYFDSAGVKGTFGMFDNGHGHFTIYNLPRFSDSFYTPGATFDVLQSLIAIQNGVVKDDSVGVIPFSQLASRIGKDTLRKWIDSLQYGNKKMGDSLEFWADGSLRINADQQLGLLKKLYFNQLPFFERTQGIVRRMMASESNSLYRLSYKTAMEREDGRAVGWAMGWIEENKHPYFFVVNLESADMTKDLQKTGLEIAKKILREQGFFAGKK